LLAVRLLLPWAVLWPAAKALHERDLMPGYPLLEFLYAAYNLLIAPIGVFRMPRRW
jgi:hypothetical protein